MHILLSTLANATPRHALAILCTNYTNGLGSTDTPRHRRGTDKTAGGWVEMILGAAAVASIPACLYEV